MEYQQGGTDEGMFHGAESFGQNLGGWNVSNAHYMEDIFEGSGISPENLSKTLVGWAKQGGYQSEKRVWWKRLQKKSLRD